ncbi:MULTISPECIES: hypothetical protein [unclassified Novosphingobium]|uniref:hypothetical protein n=1 Tax=unclassified Novosphingobium TaxID=2644732 RepID=UPI0025CE83E5|nr:MULTISPECIES: hypothetical protein [unclassified Novosphingobium]HQV04032.1 hypothetical protein [Novosphingobium sp.]
MNIDAALRNIYFWDGKEVTVVGWLGLCSGLNCGLYPTQKDALTVVQMDSNSDEWSKAVERGLGVGFVGGFDEKAAPLQFHRVKIRGRLNDDCRLFWQNTCYDRVDDIIPISIEPA